ncbi:MAG: hypothetical protein A2736_02585 [Candidatus Yanofskybacteria bacterium RIFCSPHIGHO2_01_FULL_41_27]|uniref:Uncharacterized protein n=2 Tax=Candidatus Yanofskyibacteriota TaxID=1752733 RepID=A0A1F8HVQ3_9BACT|nr:MAG: hypothetical protein A2736_02585 [Candidatus Yanofskybacteria bacterium RIFCSPHIGHO2_01_FULL_41_27]OGN10373.1 MAG: hypothetical protein A3C64_02630 [Candidatus Yanofskybacteria bacterium RIFCSPHIGHO2_02_FULL_41_12]OGN20853.1 MAG: hypothetical protein A3B00_01570 [Candidatus Yanofskybacteria bacterium RIFCSPLOWO2_01_FULL_41_33]OGN41655.1 MAG: hypothetical protein A2606_01025 [Candidatus Yanofskybacteria bacterium RIFOXYD1_FULL_42_10]
MGIKGGGITGFETESGTEDGIIGRARSTGGGKATGGFDWLTAGGETGFGEKGAGWKLFCLVNSLIKLSMEVVLLPWSSAI